MRRGWVVLASVALVAACSSSPSSAHRIPPTSQPAGPTTTVPNIPVKATCALNIPTDAITGALGSASAIGWAGNGEGVVTCLGGVFYVQNGIDKAFGFGIYGGGPTTWVNADGYLPAQITSFRHGPARVVITEFADRVDIDGHAYVVVYSRVVITNPTAQPTAADPRPSPGLTLLRSAPNGIAPNATSTYDYAIAADRFGNAYAWPSAASLAATGSFDSHYAHMRAFWNGLLAGIAQVNVPDPALNDAYRTGFIYTQIARSGTHLNTGVNGYQSEFSHDVIGILANLFTQGYFDDAHALLLEARTVIGSQGQYEDGVWTYSWPWAIYLLKTGDLAFVRANFATSGPGGPSRPSIEQTAHQIAADRTGPGGIIGHTDDIDTDGYWTVDDYEALTGLAAYRYLAQRVGNATETRWATDEYNSLLAAVNTTLTNTIGRGHLDYLPCSLLTANTANRCRNPEDANWAAPFLFGRWAWDGRLLGASISGPGVQIIDSTYAYGFRRLTGTLPPDTFGGYPGDYYTTAYNAGYGSWGLASNQHRDQGVRSYDFMIDHAQSGPYSWWESSSAPPAISPWIGRHPAAGQGSSPHAWGNANANKVLLDSIVARTVDQQLIVGRGVPDQWLTAGNPITVTNFPTSDGHRIGVDITGNGDAVTLTLDGTKSADRVRFELPIFVNNIASASTGTVDQPSGTVAFTGDQHAVTIHLHRPAA